MKNNLQKSNVKKAGGARPGAGRPKGVPNKLTTEVKTAILAAFDKVGGEDYLVSIAEKEPRAFCALLGKLIPTELTGSLTLTNDLAGRLRRAKERRNG